MPLRPSFPVASLQLARCGRGAAAKNQAVWTRVSSMFRKSNISPKSRRRGATIVEMAVIMPVFGLFIAGLLEFGHAYMVINALNAAAKKAARYGVVDEVTTADVIDRVEESLGSAVDVSKVTVQVKDASVFDNANFNPKTVNYGSLPSINLETAEPRQLFIVRVTVPYEDVAILPPFWIKNATLTGQSVNRHE
jgi:Flp pilus assembly protein TadG